MKLLQFPTCWPIKGLFVHWPRGWGVLSFSERLVKGPVTKKAFLYHGIMWKSVGRILTVKLGGFARQSFHHDCSLTAQTARFTWPTWGPPGACRPKVAPCWPHEFCYQGEVTMYSLSGVPDFFDHNKILSGYDLSHYQVPHCIRVFFDFVWFVFIHHNFQFYFELCTYCNILDIYLSQNLNVVNHLLFYMKLLNYLFFNMFGSVLECCELTGVSLLWPWLIKWK